MDSRFRKLDYRASKAHTDLAGTPTAALDRWLEGALCSELWALLLAARAYLTL
jgi:hypothetical protein